MTRILTLFLAAAMLLGLLSGCGGGSTGGQDDPPPPASPAESSEGSQTGGSSDTGGGLVENLVIGTTTAQNTFNIITQADIFGRMNYNGFCRANWVYQDASGDLQPYFMTSFDISDDGKVLDFTFPTTAVWSDGQPVTGEDVLFSFDFFKNVEKSNYLLHLENWELTGEGSGRLTFSEPDVYSYLVNACQNDGCLPKHIWEGQMDNEDYSNLSGGEWAVGCGPFKLVSNDVDAQISQYERVPENNYHGDITIEEITIKTYADQTAVLMAMLSGEIDCYYAYSSPIDATLMDMVSGDDAIDPGESYYAGQNQITFGMERPATGDRAVRSAILQCLDWQLLANVQGGETAEIPNTSLLTPSCTGFDASLPKFQQDVEAAKKTLDDAGYLDTDGDGLREMPDGSQMRLLVVPQYSKTMDLRNRIAEVLMENMAAVGIDSYIDPEMIANSEVWESNILAENYDIAIGYTTAGIAQFRSAFRYYAAEPQPGTTRESAWLWGSYHDEQFNSTIWRMISSSSQEEYLECIRLLQQVANDELIGASLGWTKAFYPYRTDRIEGWDNWASWGVVNEETWSSLRAK